MVDFQRRITELENQVDELRKQREDLYKDIEQMCLQNDSSFWSGSSVLYQRIAHTEEERDDARKERNKLKAENASLKEDLLQFRFLKRDADQISKDEMEKAKSLEVDLQFYKEELDGAILDKDISTQEREELKRVNEELEDRLSDAKGRVEAEMVQRKNGEKQLKEAQKRVGELEERLIECARIPELESQLSQHKEECGRLQTIVDDLETELDATREQLEISQEDVERTQQLHQDLEQQLEKVKREAKAAFDLECARAEELEAKLASNAAELNSQTAELQDADAAVAAAQAQVEAIQCEKEMEVSNLRMEYQSEIDDLKQQLKDLQKHLDSQVMELNDVTTAKVEALMKLSESQSKCSELQSRVTDLQGRNGRLERLVGDRRPETPPNPTAAHDNPSGNSWFTPWAARTPPTNGSSVQVQDST